MSSAPASHLRIRRATRSAFRRDTGFTLGELLVFGVVLVILVAGGRALYVGWSTSAVDFGVNGVVETRCVNGFKVLVGQSGSVQQLLDEKGGGIPCTPANAAAAAAAAARPAAAPIPR